MNGPKPGDRVRVVLEGEVTSDYCGTEAHFIIGCGKAENVITPAAPHVVSVEILRPPVKVGDVIETAEQLDALPDDTVVLNRYRTAVQRDTRAWYVASTTGTGFSSLDMALPVTVLYLPDGAA